MNSQEEEVCRTSPLTPELSRPFGENSVSKYLIIKCLLGARHPVGTFARVSQGWSDGASTLSLRDAQ